MMDESHIIVIFSRHFVDITENLLIFDKTWPEFGVIVIILIELWRFKPAAVLIFSLVF